MLFFEKRLCAALGRDTCGQIYLAAVSGGADSTAMLAGLAALRKDMGFVLHCIHVEHGIRPPEESEGDARAVQALCEGLEIPCRVLSIPQGKIAAFSARCGTGMGAAARLFRHRAFRREAKRIGAGQILTAHTRDDLLETIIMRILRGCGPAGLAPMPRSRGLMLRPLLDLGRQDVLAYLAERGISHQTDSSNANIRYLRNRVRHKLVPILDEFFPYWRSSLLALAQTQSLAADFIITEAGKRLPWESLAGGDLSLRLPEADFFTALPILREEAVFIGADMLAALADSGFENIAVPRRSAVRRAAEQAGQFIAQDLGPIRLQKQDGYIEMRPANRARGERGFSLLVQQAKYYTLKGSVFGLGKALLCIQAGASGACRDSDGFYALFPLVFRNHLAADTIFRGGHKRRFSDILKRDIRSGYTGIITAEDAEGTAAFIGIGHGGDLLILNREDAGGSPNDSSLHGVSVEIRFR